MESKISIIIPLFNGQEHLRDTLNSVRDQTYQHWECLIVDDGSTDASESIAREYSKNDNRFVFLKRPDTLPKGPSACRNTGWEQSRGNYIIFLDSDDLLSSDCLENRMKFAGNNQDADAWIFTTKTFINAPWDENKIFNRTTNANSAIEYLDLFWQGKYPFCVMGPMWKRTALETCQGFDHRLQQFEDPDLHIRALTARLTFVTEPTGTVDSFYRITFRKPSEMRTTSQQTRIIRSALVFFGKHVVNYREEVKEYARRFFWKEVVPYGLSSASGKMYGLLLKHRLLTGREVIGLPFLLLYKKFGWDRRKGTGYQSMKRWINPKNSII